MKSPQHGYGQLVLCQTVACYVVKGELVLAKASPDQFTELAVSGAEAASELSGACRRLVLVRNDHDGRLPPLACEVPRWPRIDVATTIRNG